MGLLLLSQLALATVMRCEDRDPSHISHTGLYLSMPNVDFWRYAFWPVHLGALVPPDSDIGEKVMGDPRCLAATSLYQSATTLEQGRFRQEPRAGHRGRPVRPPPRA